MKKKKSQSTIKGNKHKSIVDEERRGNHRSVVRVVGGHGGGGLGGELVELAGGDALVDAGADLLRDEDWVAVVAAEAIAQLLQPRRDLVEVHRLLTTVSLHHVHPSLSISICVYMGFVIVQ